MPVPLSPFRFYWNLNESSGTRFDSTPNRNDLITAVGSPTAATGKIGNGLQTSVPVIAQSYMETASSLSVSLGPIDFTMWGWYNMNSDDTSFGEIIATVGGYFLSNTGGFGTGKMNWAFRHPLDPSGFASITGPAITVDSAFHFVMLEHIVATKTLNLFVDDVTTAITTTTYTGTLAAPVATQARAGYRGGNVGAPWVVDELALYAAVLTQPEKDCVFNSGAGGTYPIFCGTNNVYFQAQMARGADQFPVSSDALGTVTGYLLTDPTPGTRYIVKMPVSDINGVLPNENWRIRVFRDGGATLDTSTASCSLEKAQIEYDVS